ncbi:MULTISPECIES: GNAT family N-acetyltransferase [unclassified Caballeronia]|uniref:bifunctional acetate--CoA ligase family protein/GNAT family N-acetyltransferase n=1 Tax=unclassified Caballeronia TaxID=2646786 RepID=UPI002863F6B7|nr:MULTISPECIES: GNAT family N-acetyltransferase [unclassified Caballeronia]MDR5776167.1 GNAT family N-acetyltransferase [Caballeronia sp. LZ002]MDR5851607.1 GNAT family N-acetyltransferase [Caballeronia sp. LZ003]
MTVRNLDILFAPKSIAVIGASTRPGSIGEMVWARANSAGFKGPIWPVNPKHQTIGEQPSFADLAHLPEAPSVAVLCTPPKTWPQLVEQLGDCGTKAVVVIGEAARHPARAEFISNAESHEWTARTLAAARPFLLRVVGPASLGVVSPAVGACLGAPACSVKSGGVAWVSGSNALTNGVLGWARARGLGFSRIVALGDEADVDSGDILDFLATDASTKAILLAIETVRAARKFISAARAAARNKPVLVLRTGHDDPFDRLYGAAFRRAGLVRVDSLDDLLDEIETLGVGSVAAGDVATVITSDRGVATLARDAFSKAGDDLAQWPLAARDAVSLALPRAESGNPLLLGDDASPADFGIAVKTLAPHRDTGTIFVVHAPTHSAPVADVARTLIAARRHAHRGLLACFFGCVDAATRDALHANGIPVHTTPQRLARGFARLVDFRQGRELLMQTPDGLPTEIPEEIDIAQNEIRIALENGIAELNGERAARILARFGITVKPGPPDSFSADAVEIQTRLLNHRVFGPVFEFKAEGALGLADALHEFALPPLNPVLARDLVVRSPRSRELPTDMLLNALTALSQMVCYIEEIVALRLTLRVTRDSVAVHEPQLTLGAHRKQLAIVPYPRCMDETLDWRGMRITVRPIRPEDENAHRAFVSANTAEDLRLRFFGAVRNFDHSQLARMTQIDYDREMALIVTRSIAEGATETLGVARAISDPDNETAEFAVAARSDMKGKGLGSLLLTRIIDYARERGTRWLVGEALRENTGMIALARKAGFELIRTEDPSVVGFRMRLGEKPT